MAWTTDQIEFDFEADRDLTEHPFATARIKTPIGVVKAMAEVEERGRVLVLRGFNIESDLGPNALGIQKLRAMAQAMMERMDYDELVIEGAVRTSGAGPRRIPSPLRFTRRRGPAPGAKPESEGGLSDYGAC